MAVGKKGSEASAWCLRIKPIVPLKASSVFLNQPGAEFRFCTPSTPPSDLYIQTNRALLVAPGPFEESNGNLSSSGTHVAMKILRVTSVFLIAMKFQAA